MIKKLNFKSRYVVVVLAAFGIMLIAGLNHLTAQGFGKYDTVVAKVVLSQQPGLHSVMVKLKQQIDPSQFTHIANLEQRKKLMYRALVAQAQSTQKDILEYLKNQNVQYRSFYLLNAVYAAGLTVEQIKSIAARAEVASVYTDADLTMLPPLFVEPMGPQPFHQIQTIGANITAIGADRVWNELGTKGAGIVVAGQDTGVEWDHPALRRQYRGAGDMGEIGHNYNWYDAIREPISGDSRCLYASDVPCDDNDHGTHTVGTIVGSEGNRNQIGVAPESQWIACRNMDNGTGRPHTYLACFEFFFAPYPTDGDAQKDGRPEKAPHVMNNSWGCPSSEQCQGDILFEALRVLKAAGLFVVVSAGNDGPACKTIQDTPAWHSRDTFSVGAVNHSTKLIAQFSSRGPSAFVGMIGPDITAPGVNIRSAVTGKKYDQFMWSGTSMAGPHVVGVVALMWSANRNLIGKIDETIDLLQRTAEPIPSVECMGNTTPAVPNNAYGYGLVNAYKAVQAALQY